MNLRASGLAAVFAASLFTVDDARAQKPDETARAAVRSLAREGDTLMDSGDYDSALERYRKAGALIPAPTVRVREAMCLEKLGRWIEATDVYRLVSRMHVVRADPKPFHEAVEQATRQATALEARIPKLVITVKGQDIDGAEVRVDEQIVPAVALGTGWPVDPGKHRLTASKGPRRVELVVQAEESASTPVVLTLPAPRQDSVPAARAGSAQPTVGWVAIGLGAAGLAAGAITGAVAMSKKSSLQSDGTCVDDRCPSSAQNEVNAVNAMRTASTVSFVVGGLGLGAGLVLLLAAPSDSKASPQANVQPWVGLGAAGVNGRF